MAGKIRHDEEHRAPRRGRDPQSMQRRRAGQRRRLRACFADFVALFARDLRDAPGVDQGVVARRARDERPAAQHVDPPRNPSSPAVDFIHGADIEGRPALPADLAQTMLDVGAGFFTLERPEVARHANLFAHRQQVRRSQHSLQLRLPDETDLHAASARRAAHRQTDQLIEGVGLKVLRLVDDEHGPSPLRTEMGQKPAQTCGERQGPLARGGEAESDRDGPQQLFGVELGADDLGHDEVLRLQLAQDGPNGSRLACTDLAGDDGEARRFRQASPQRRQHPVVTVTVEVEVGVGAQLKR